MSSCPTLVSHTHFVGHEGSVGDVLTCILLAVSPRRDSGQPSTSTEFPYQTLHALALTIGWPAWQENAF